MLRIGVMVSGGGTNLQALIDAGEAGYFDGKIVTVLCSNPKAYVLQRAEKHGISALCLRKRDYPQPGAYEQAIIDHFRQQQVDLIVMAGFMVILDDSFVAAFRNRIMNIHPALIPAFCGPGYYGLKVHEAVLARGVKVTGATVHFVNEITDGGPIIIQKAVDVREGDTPEILQLRVMEEAEWKILPEAVRLYAAGKLVIEDNIVHVK